MNTANFARPTMRPVFLESLDSVRTAGNLTDNSPVNELMATLEAIAVLAMGDQIAVPQTYAFDSSTFQAVAARLISARGRADLPTDVPIGVRLFRQESFESAAGDMLKRIREGKFLSSLYPELTPWPNDLESSSVDALLKFLGTNDPADARRSWLEALQGEFRHTAKDWSSESTQLPARIERLRAYLKRRILGPVDDQLTHALDKLWYDGAFADRTRIRTDTSWLDGGTRSAREILADDATWLLVIEVVDTLYNRVLADSLQIGASALSTPPGISDDRLRARAVAQRIALDADLCSSPHGEPREKRSSTAFEYRIEAASLQSDTYEKVAKELLLSEHLNKALAALLEARHPTNRTFWGGVRKVRAAHVEGHRDGTDSAVREHLRYVSDIMGRDIEVHQGFLRGAAVTFSRGVAKEGTALSAGYATAAAGAPTWLAFVVALGVAGAIEVGDSWLQEHPARPPMNATYGALTEIVQLARENA